MNIKINLLYLINQKANTIIKAKIMEKRIFKIKFLEFLLLY